MPIPPKEPFRHQVENMVWGLFTQNSTPFFDKSDIPPALLDEFVHSEAVFLAASSFALALRALWKDQHPHSDLHRSALAAAAHPDVKPLVFHDLSPSALPHEPPAMTDPTPEAPVPAAGAAIDLAKRPGAVPFTSAAPGKIVARAASFQTANAKAGQAYAGKIERLGTAPGATRLRDIHLPEGLGLTVADDGQSLAGTPAVAGDHEITFQWSDDGLSWSAGKCILIVNPEPRSLWQVNEPAADSPYPKPHLDARLISTPAFKIAAASRRGRSHEHSGTFRDDDFFISHDAASGWAVIIVADGAGSAKSSRWGSKLAVEAAGAHLAASLAGAPGAAMSQVLDLWEADPAAAVNDVGAKFHYLFHETGTLAVQAIEQEAQAQGVPVKDYATTLLAAAIRKQGAETFLATFWMGDGAIAAYGPRGKVRLMGSPDGGEFAGQTRFLDRAALTDAGFAKRVGIGRFADVEAVMLMTDGISDPRFETDNGLADGAKWDALWDELAPCLAAQDADQQLLSWLEFFIPGHHDDRTIAMLW